MSFIKRFFPILVVIAFMTFFTFQSTEATMKVSDGERKSDGLEGLRRAFLGWG